MLIKFLKPYKMHKLGAIIDTDDIKAKLLIKNKTAEAYKTAEAEPQPQPQKK